MTNRVSNRWTIRSAALALLGLLLALHGATAVELVGTEQAVFEWAPATGPVSGYYVIVSTNGGPDQFHAFATGSQATVQSRYGDTIVVTVAAFDAEGMPGPVSPRSEPVPRCWPVVDKAGRHVAGLDGTLAFGSAAMAKALKALPGVQADWRTVKVEVPCP